MNKVHKIHNKTFDFIIYWIDSDNDFARDWLQKKGIEVELSNNYGDSIQGVTIHDQGLDVMFIGEHLDYVILHECIHAIQGILETKIGVETGYDNTEVLAYTVDWLYREILYRYHKSRGNDIYKTYKI